MKTEMKKKTLSEPMIAPEILALAQKSVEGERPAVTKPCAVCGAACSASAFPQAADENLCWVCRRLKISAWLDSDQQLAAQE